MTDSSGSATGQGLLDITIERHPSPVPEQRRAEILAAPGFGNFFTDHMVEITWTDEAGWHDAQLRPYAPLQIDPASAVLHYAQEIFEGLKAYRHDDGSVWTFRPEQNAERFQRSAARMALPQLPAEVFLHSVDTLVRTDRAWVPTAPESSLYLRPFMFASEVFLGVRPAKRVTFIVIASPAGAYFTRGPEPVSIWLSEEYTRAAPGGTGAAKCGGNYAASLIAQAQASEHGCDQVCFLDALENRWVEELGGMNLYFVYEDGSIVTPELSGSILAGVTRQSVLTLGASLGHKVEERRVGIDEWRSGVESGRITEVFACGTAAVVTPVGSLVSSSGTLQISGERAGPVTAEIRQALLDVQYGHAPDEHGWLHPILP